MTYKQSNMLFDSIHTLHIEPTTVCNAACPQCARETDILFDHNNQVHLTVDQIQSLIPTSVLKKLKKVYFCGVYGDPAAGHNTLDIAKFFRTYNSEIVLGMNTNGSLQNTQWWKNLAKIWNRPEDYVVFSIDGLEDTNHLYRRNTDFHKIVSNAQAFINENGQAHWDMLVFEHNEHQVSDALDLANSLGLKWFRQKVTRRFDTHTVAWLQPPKSLISNTIASYQVLCQAEQEQSLYISAQGHIHACCWMAAKHQKVKHWVNHDFNHSVCQSTCKTQFKNQWLKEIELQ